MIIRHNNAGWQPGRDARAVRHPAARGAARLTGESGPVVVAGGGIAGIAAAVGLAERGVPVIMVERPKLPDAPSVETVADALAWLERVHVSTSSARRGV